MFSLLESFTKQPSVWLLLNQTFYFLFLNVLFTFMNLLELFLFRQPHIFIKYKCLFHQCVSFKFYLCIWIPVQERLLFRKRIHAFQRTNYQLLTVSRQSSITGWQHQHVVYTTMWKRRRFPTPQRRGPLKLKFTVYGIFSAPFVRSQGVRVKGRNINWKDWWVMCDGVSIKTFLLLLTLLKIFLCIVKQKLKQRWFLTTTTFAID